MKKKFVFLTGILALLISFIFDKQIIFWVTSHRLNFLNNFMIWISYLGTGYFVFFFMTTLFLWEERKRKWILPLWLSLGLSLFITYLLKILIMRERPYLAFQFINNLMTDTNPLKSFPSGHATAVFSALAVLDKEFPKLKWFWLCFACLVAFSRIYLGVHYLSDVIAGALIGGSIGSIFVLFEEKYRIHKIFKLIKKRLNR